jgi:hypothetical protein
MTLPNLGKVLVASAVMLPRQVLFRQFYLITRRCTQRQFLLRPDRETNNAFTYALIEAAQRTQIDVLLPCAMSNHYHAVVFDRFGRYPEFVEHFHTAPIMFHSLGPVTDVFTPNGDYICAPNIHTDGVYAWPEDLAYYVERYHVAPPAEFLAHLAAAKWIAPADVDTSTIELGRAIGRSGSDVDLGVVLWLVGGSVSRRGRKDPPDQSQLALS